MASTTHAMPGQPGAPLGRTGGGIVQGDQGAQPLRRRLPRQYPNSIPNITPDVSGLPVSSKYAAPMENSDLLEVANAFSRLECHIIDCLIKAHRTSIFDPDYSAKYPSYVLELKRQAASLEQAYRDLKDVHSGKYQFSNSYLKDGELLEFWNGYLSVLHYWSSRPNEPGSHGHIANILGIERRVASLLGPLRHAAKQGALDMSTRNAIGSKYQVLDDMFDLRYKGIVEKRVLPTWQELSEELRLLKPKLQTLHTGTQTGSTSSILWIIFVITVICGGPLSAYAWDYSNHQPGTWADDDFFFLLQNSTLQILGIIVTARTLSNSKAKLSWLWRTLPSTTAVFSTALAPMLYCYVPKWWSSFLTVIAGSVQAFMVLQLAIHGT